jgi:hypothetical protein
MYTNCIIENINKYRFFNLFRLCGVFSRATFSDQNRELLTIEIKLSSDCSDGSNSSGQEPPIIALIENLSVS